MLRLPPPPHTHTHSTPYPCSVDGDCIPCPKNPALLISMFITAIVLMCVAAWWMNQKKLNMGILAIGIDYFQVPWGC